jgi:copper chaperone NosL
MTKEAVTMSANLAKGLLLAVAIGAAAFVFVRFNQVTIADGPVDIVWDSETCGHCKMHVGDPRFAAQLHTTDGTVMSFDDPGCMFDYLEAHELSVHAVYFRNHQADGWLTESEVAFLPVDDSPMGYGIAAVPKGTPDAHDIDWAKSQVLSRPHHHHGGS